MTAAEALKILYEHADDCPDKTCFEIEQAYDVLERTLAAGDASAREREDSERFALTASRGIELALAPAFVGREPPLLIADRAALVVAELVAALASLKALEHELDATRRCARCGLYEGEGPAEQRHGRHSMLCGRCVGEVTVDLRAEVERVRSLIALDRTGLAAALDGVRKLVDGYRWIQAGETGGYAYHEWDVTRLREEVGRLIDGVVEISTRGLRESGALADSAFHPRAEDADGQRALHEVAEESEAERLRRRVDELLLYVRDARAKKIVETARANDAENRARHREAAIEAFDEIAKTTFPDYASPTQVVRDVRALVERSDRLSAEVERLRDARRDPYAVAMRQIVEGGLPRDTVVYVGEGEGKVTAGDVLASLDGDQALAEKFLSAARKALVLSLTEDESLEKKT